MSILRKRGVEKLRFRIMNRRVTNEDFEYLKGLCLQCLNENPDIAERLDEIYKLIQVYFFYETTDLNAANSLRSILNDSTITYPTKPTPAFCESRTNVGCIMVFLKHLNECAQRREDIKDKDRFNQGHFLEELCHLVKHGGDSRVHSSVHGYWILWDIYKSKGLQQYGNIILGRLRSARDHYEVFPMMIEACPEDWVVRCWKYFDKSIDYYKKGYEDEKTKFPTNIVYANLIANYIGAVSVLYVTERIPERSITDEYEKLLDAMKQKGKVALELSKSLIQGDMGAGALHTVELVDESVFETRDVFFSRMLAIWSSLHLV